MALERGDLDRLKVDHCLDRHIIINIAFAHFTNVSSGELTRASFLVFRTASRPATVIYPKNGNKRPRGAALVEPLSECSI